MKFNMRLAGILAEQNLKQADLCRMTGISTALMSNYMTGKASPSLDNALIIAKALGITLDNLVGRETLRQSTDEEPRRGISAEETTLLADYDSLSVEGQVLIKSILSSLKQTHGRGLIMNTGTNYGVIGGDFSHNVQIR